MSGNLLVRFDEGKVGRTQMSPSLLLYYPSRFKPFSPRSLESSRAKRNLLRPMHPFAAAVNRTCDIARRLFIAVETVKVT